MRKLKIIEHISLAGVIQAPAGPNEDGDCPWGGWTLPYRDPAAGKAVLAAHSEPFDLLLGRRTYDIWSGFWPKAPSSPLADSLNAATKYVATYRPDSLEMGSVRGPRTGHRRGRSPHQGDGRSRPDPLGQFDADIDAARTRACGRGLAVRLSNPVGQREAFLFGRDPAKRTRTGQHERCVLWRP